MVFMSNKDVKETLIRAAKKAGERALEEFGKTQDIEFKGVIDIVTAMDKEAEAIVISEIKKDYPDHGIITEESDEQKTTSGCRWIIDPIDGTTNYAHGFPFFCTSIGFERDGVIEAGCVYLPYMNELFFAQKGKGAFLNDKPIKVSTIKEVDKSLLATGFPYDIRTSKNNNLDNFNRVVKTAQAIRRPGAAAIDLCYVAAGRLEGFWEVKLKSWDMAAGKIILEEAGGKLTGFDGEEFSIYKEYCLATNGFIHDELVEFLEA